MSECKSLTETLIVFWVPISLPSIKLTLEILGGVLSCANLNFPRVFVLTEKLTKKQESRF